MVTLENNKPAEILLVDDDLISLTVLETILEMAGYKVRTITNGPQALEYVKNEHPDLILLDISMPDMNGYDVCNCLKADPLSKDIPVIFITALDRIEDKICAFQIGGADYICKPFQDGEALARVRVHLELQKQKKIISENYEKLRELESLRDNLVSLIVHDMQSPLATIQCVLMEEIRELSAGKEGNLKLIQLANSSTTRLMEMATQMLLISSCETKGIMPLEKTSENLTQVAQLVRDSLQISAGSKKLILRDELPIHANFDKEIICRVISNFVSNAIKYSPENGEVTLTVTHDNGYARVSVSDEGPGIELAYHKSIFEKFFQVSDEDGAKKHHGFGLGLHFCRLAVETHGGQIGVFSEVDKGSTFWFTIPLQSCFPHSVPV